MDNSVLMKTNMLEKT